MSDALVGHTGFVGSTLLRQRTFDCLYRSTNVGDMDGRHFDLVVCAGVSAKKWLANRDPDGDRRGIEGLVSHLSTIEAERFVLVSTVDVFKAPILVDESTQVEKVGLHPYGLHRRELEEFVQDRFKNVLIVRLPGLVGAGLVKNVVFDLLNDNNLDQVDSRGVHQYYPMKHLWKDISLCLDRGLSLVHLTAAPVSVREAAKVGFGLDFRNELAGRPAAYDFRSMHARFWGQEHYQYTKEQSLAAIREYALTEPRTRA